MKRKTLSLAFALVLFAGFSSASLGSPSSVEVTSDEGFFEGYDGDVIRFQWTDDSFSNDQATVPAEDITAETPGQATEDLTIRTRDSVSRAIYDIREAGYQDVRPVDYKRNTWTWSLWNQYPGDDEAIDTMRSWGFENGDDFDGDGDTTVYSYVNKPLGLDIYGYAATAAWSNDKSANIGDVELQKVEMGTEFCVNGDCEVVSNSFDQDEGEGEKSQSFSNTVLVQFQGGLDTGYRYSNLDNTLIAYNNEDYWPVSEIRYNNYMDYVRGTPEDKETLQGLAEGWEGFSTADLEGSVQNQIDDALREYDESKLNDYSYNINKESDGAGRIVVDSDRQNHYATYQVTVKASEVGYFIPDANPTIEDIRIPDTAEEGDEPSVEVDVGNDGNGEGAFTAYLTGCTDGFNSPGSSQNARVDPGQTDTVSLDFSFNSESNESREIEGNCDVVVENDRDKDEQVRETITLTGKQSPNCDPGRYGSIQDDGSYVLMECSDNGLEKTEIAECAGDEDGDGEVDEIVREVDGVKQCAEPISNIDEDEEEDDSSSGEDNDSSDTEECEPLYAVGQLPGGGHVFEIEDPFCGVGLVEKVHTGFAAAWAFIGGGLFFYGFRWLDGERRIKGGFNPFATRNVSRYERGNVLIGAVGFLAGLYVGFQFGLWLPLLVQIIGAVALIYLGRVIPG